MVKVFCLFIPLFDIIMYYVYYECDAAEVWGTGWSIW